MIPDIKRILYATDLSMNSAYAFHYAVKSAENHNAKIVILHVNEALSSNAQAMVVSYMTGEQARAIFEEKESDAHERIRKRLQLLCEKELKDKSALLNMIDSIEVCEGYPPDEILKMADEFACDMIVMGTHGKGLIENAFIGSTAKRVLRRTHKPIFIIPIPEGKIDLSIQD